MADEEQTEIDPNELSVEVATEAMREEVARGVKLDPGERPLDEPYPDDEDPGDPMDEKPEPPPPPPPRTYKVKENGKERDVSAAEIDAAAKALGIEPESVLRGAQMLRAGQERLREAAAKEKEASIIKRAMIEGASGNLSKETRRALQAAGVREEEIYNFAIKQVNELMEIDRLKRENPAELERRQSQAALEEVEAERQKALMEVHETRAVEKLNQEIKTALDTAKLPRDPRYVRLLAGHMLEHMERGGEADDLKVEDFIPLVLKEVESDHQEFLGRLSGEDLIARFPGMAEKVRKAYAKRVRTQGPPERQPSSDGAPPARSERRQHERMSATEVLRRFRAGDFDGD